MEKFPHIPDEGDYSVNFNPNEFLEQVTVGGEARTRRDLIDPAHTVTLTFTCDPKKYAEIVAFMGDNLGRNCAPFLIDLQIYSNEYTEETVVAVPFTFKLVSHNALKYVVSLEVEIASDGEPFNQYTEGKIVDLVGGDGDNVYTDSRVAVVMTGFDPSATYRLTLPVGLTFTAWSAYSIDGAAPGGMAWRNDFFVTTGILPYVGIDDPRTTMFGFEALYATPEIARAAFESGTITGSDTYGFWLYDPNDSDDRGGLSIKIEKI